jgi:hypothetical protein
MLLSGVLNGKKMHCIWSLEHTARVLAALPRARCSWCHMRIAECGSIGRWNDWQMPPGTLAPSLNRQACKRDSAASRGCCGQRLLICTSLSGIETLNVVSLSVRISYSLCVICTRCRTRPDGAAAAPPPHTMQRQAPGGGGVSPGRPHSAGWSMPRPKISWSKMRAQTHAAGKFGGARTG